MAYRCPPPPIERHLIGKKALDAAIELAHYIQKEEIDVQHFGYDNINANLCVTPMRGLAANKLKAFENKLETLADKYHLKLDEGVN